MGMHSLQRRLCFSLCLLCFCLSGLAGCTQNLYSSTWFPVQQAYTVLHDRMMPVLLNTCGLMPTPPEDLAWQLVDALDQGNHQAVHTLVEGHSVEAHQALHALSLTWPHGMRGRPGTFIQVGPYHSDRWDKPVPIGTLRRIPISVSYAGGQIRTVLWFSRAATAWQLIRVT